MVLVSDNIRIICERNCLIQRMSACHFMVLRWVNGTRELELHNDLGEKLSNTKNECMSLHGAKVGKWYSRVTELQNDLREELS